MSNGSESTPEHAGIPYETDEGVVVAVDIDGMIHRMKPLLGAGEDAQKAWEAYEESEAFAKDRTEVMHLPVDSVDTGPHSARAIGLSEALGDDVAGDIAYDALLLGFNAGRGSVHDNFESLRSRIAALEAVIERVREAARENATDGELFYSTYHVDRALALAPSVVLDGMIREAKAEAWDEGAHFGYPGRPFSTESWDPHNPYRKDGKHQMSDGDALRAQLDGMTTEWGTTARLNRLPYRHDTEAEARAYQAQRLPGDIHLVARKVTDWAEVTD